MIQESKILAMSATKRFGPASRATYQFSGNDKWKGYMRATAAEVARAAKTSVDHYALARACHSEFHSGTVIERLAVCETIQNDAKLKNASGVASLLTRFTRKSRAWTQGYFGEQSGRRFATTREPCKQCAAIADYALRESSNLVRGATKFLDVISQLSGSQGGRKIRSPESVLSDWAGDGYGWIGHRPNIRTEKLLLLRPMGREKAKAGMVDTMAYLQAVRAGRYPHAPTLGAGAKVAAAALAVGGAALVALPNITTKLPRAKIK